MGYSVKTMAGAKRLSAVVAAVALLVSGGAIAMTADEASATQSPSPVESVPVESVPAESVPGESVPGESVVASSAMFGASSLPADAGITVPGLKNEVPADVLGLGYEQVVRLNESKVEVLDPVSRGSKVLRSFEAGAKSAWPTYGFGLPLFYGGTNMTTKVAHHQASRVAVAGRHIYVSNLLTKTTVDPWGKTIVTENGSVLKRYTADGHFVDERYEADPGFAITALDGFVWNDEEYLAIGYNKLGVRIVKPAVDGMPNDQQLLTHWSGPERGLAERDQVIEVKFGTDVDGRLLLAVGAVTQELPALAMLDVGAGEEEEIGREIWTKNFRPHTAGWEWPEVIAFGKLGDEGRPHVAVGWPTLGTVSFMDATTGQEKGSLGGGVVSVIRFFTDATGEHRVGIRRGIGQDFTSHVARLDAGGSPAFVENGGAGELEWMVPGYRAVSMHVENRSRAEISFKNYSGAVRTRGCWYSAELKGASPTLPKQAVRVAPGAKAGPYASAWRTVGEQCYSADIGVFYLQVDVPGEPGQRRIVQLQGDRTGIRIKEQVGSDRVSVQVEPRDARVDGPFGVRLIVTDTHEAPSIVGAPTLEGARLTPAPAEGRAPTDKVDDPSRPVHRFTVSDVSWQVPGAGSGLTEAQLPLPVAEGSVDGQTWVRLGTVASPVAPTREGDRVTMGRAVFDWQTPPRTSSDYRYIRVSAGAAVSNVIDRRALPVPPEAPVVGGVSITAEGGARANGLDQAPMRVSLVGTDLRNLDATTHAALYQRIYYRDGLTKALITGLGDPDDPSQLVMFSTTPGQYSNEGATASAATSIGAYFSTRSTQPGRQVRAMFKHTATGPDALEGSAPLTPITNPLVPAQDSAGARGISIDTCAEGACTLADPSAAPALHSLTSTSVSVQLASVAVHGAASLPLSAPNMPGELLTVAEDGFEIWGSRAVLRNPSVFGYNATISGQVITHGERVVLENLYV
ncbi:hypothetical protein [Agromyces aerolatus]|uniref:hypothetical protein n=1 Tax=Agromyces sp. LY-1074 TaxID=3074080 RepID=UPI0028671987|nr:MULTISPECIES: hypothetical protein [unclassified Agromyces]MDR5701676.1 hypothetical protein [Agromyces sp. LY-1074]MDR5707977.1 hypothetical protein [Agromyces sp. LY-1358]